MKKKLRLIFSLTAIFPSPPDSSEKRKEKKLTKNVQEVLKPFILMIHTRRGKTKTP